jgi:hypothetical protein
MRHYSGRLEPVHESQKERQMKKPGLHGIILGDKPKQEWYKILKSGNKILFLYWGA